VTGWGPALSESQTEAVEVPFDRRVALTRSRLETFPIEDSDAAMHIFDEPVFCRVPATRETVGRAAPIQRARVHFAATTRAASAARREQARAQTQRDE
jgi:hypothetical protein